MPLPSRARAAAGLNWMWKGVVRSVCFDAALLCLSAQPGDNRRDTSMYEGFIGHRHKQCELAMPGPTPPHGTPVMASSLNIGRTKGLIDRPKQLSHHA